MIEVQMKIQDTGACEVVHTACHDDFVSFVEILFASETPK